MCKKAICAVIVLALAVLCGCDGSRKIERAAIVENITVEESGGKTVYTFYVLKSGDEPRGVSVEAASFEEASALASERYLPNLSLDKLELLLIEKGLAGRVMKKDVEYIATQPSYSPIAYVALCDSETIRLMKEDNNGVPSLIENQLILIKNKNSGVKIDYLSVYNSFHRNNSNGFKAAYISHDRELKVNLVKIK